MDFYLNIVTIEKSFFSGLVKKIQVSGIEGDIGIYPGHSQLLSVIRPGIIYLYHKNKNEECFYVSGGILEVQPSVVSILAEVVIHYMDLNHESILKEQKRIIENLKKKHVDRDKNIFLLKLSKTVAKLRVLKIMKTLKNK